MPSTGVFTATDEGYVDLGSVVQVYDVWCRLVSTTNPRTYLMGSAQPRQIKFPGRIGLSINVDDPDMGNIHLVNWGHYLHWEWEDPNSYFMLIGSDRFFWRLALGTEWQFRVWW